MFIITYCSTQESKAKEDSKMCGFTFLTTAENHYLRQSDWTYTVLSFSFFSFLSLALHSSCFSVIPKAGCFLLLICSVPTLQSTCKGKNSFLTEFSLAVFFFSHFSLSHMHLGLENSFLLISCILPSSFVSILIWCKCSLKWKKLLLAGISLLPFYFPFFLVLPPWNVSVSWSFCLKSSLSFELE